MEQLINITDAVFLGHVGEVELGASAIAGIYHPLDECPVADGRKDSFCKEEVGRMMK